MELGEIPMEDPNQPHLLKAAERMRQIEEKYGKENLGWDDVVAPAKGTRPATNS